MKRLLLLAALVLSVMSVQAQKIKVSESNEKIAKGNHNSLVVTIYGMSADDIEKEWRSKMKDYDAKVSSKDGVFADNALIPSISKNTVDVYARAEKAGDGEVKFIVAFQLGETWLSSTTNKDAYNEAEKIVADFARKLTKDGMGALVKAEQKKLDKLKDEQSDLEKKNKDLKADIEGYKDKIKKAEDSIKENESEQSKKKLDIEAQQKVLEAAQEKERKVE